MSAFQRAVEKERLPLGIFYINTDKSTFEENVGIYSKDKTALSLRETERMGEINDLLESKK